MCLFIVNDIVWAQPDIYSSQKSATLATPTELPDPEFREKFMFLRFLLTRDDVDNHINAQIEKEKLILRDKWEKYRTEEFDLSDPKIRGDIKYDVEGLESVTFIGVIGLLAHTGQFARSEPSGKDYGGTTVIYIDNQFFRDPAQEIQKYYLDGILQWERLRINILKIKTRAEMRQWIKDHIDSADERLNNTEFKGKTALRIAETFHRSSYRLSSISKKYEGVIDIDYEYINLMLSLYRTDEKSGNVNIASHTDNPVNPSPPAENKIANQPKISKGPEKDNANTNNRMELLDTIREVLLENDLDGRYKSKVGMIKSAIRDGKIDEPQGNALLKQIREDYEKAKRLQILQKAIYYFRENCEGLNSPNIALYATLYRVFEGVKSYCEKDVSLKQAEEKVEGFIGLINEILEMNHEGANCYIEVKQVLAKKKKFYRNTFKDSKDNRVEVVIRNFAKQEDNPYLQEDRIFFMVRVWNKDGKRIGYFVLYPTKDKDVLDVSQRYIKWENEPIPFSKEVEGLLNLLDVKRDKVTMYDKEFNNLEGRYSHILVRALRAKGDCILDAYHKIIELLPEVNPVSISYWIKKMGETGIRHLSVYMLSGKINSINKVLNEKFNKDLKELYKEKLEESNEPPLIVFMRFRKELAGILPKNMAYLANVRNMSDLLFVLGFPTYFFYYYEKIYTALKDSGIFIDERFYQLLAEGKDADKAIKILIKELEILDLDSSIKELIIRKNIREVLKSLDAFKKINSQLTPISSAVKLDDETRGLISKLLFIAERDFQFAEPYLTNKIKEGDYSFSQEEISAIEKKYNSTRNIPKKMYGTREGWGKDKDKDKDKIRAWIWRLYLESENKAELSDKSMRKSRITWHKKLHRAATGAYTSWGKALKDAGLDPREFSEITYWGKNDEKILSIIRILYDYNLDLRMTAMRRSPIEGLRALYLTGVKRQHFNSYENLINMAGRDFGFNYEMIRYSKEYNPISHQEMLQETIDKISNILKKSVKAPKEIRFVKSMPEAILRILRSINSPVYWKALIKKIEYNFDLPCREDLNRAKLYEYLGRLKGEGLVDNDSKDNWWAVEQRSVQVENNIYVPTIDELGTNTPGPEGREKSSADPALIAELQKIEPPPVSKFGDPNNYAMNSSGRIVSKFFSKPIKSPINPSIFVPPIVEAHSLEEIRIGRLPVESDGDKPFYGLENNLYYPEYNLYVINTDNLTFYALAEAAKRGDIELDASIFTFDAHEDLLSPKRLPPDWKVGSLKDYAAYTIRITPLEQLIAAKKLGLLKEIHLIMSTMPARKSGSGIYVYRYPTFPVKVFQGLPRNKVVAHIDLDFHSEEFEELDKIVKGKPLHQLLKDPKLIHELLKEPEKVDSREVEKFKLWVKRMGFFRRAGLKIICVSPDIVHPEDILWLTKEHVKLVMEESQDREEAVMIRKKAELPTEPAVRKMFLLNWVEPIKTAVAQLTEENTELIEKSMKPIKIERKHIIEKIKALYNQELTEKAFDNILYGLKKYHKIGRDELGFPKHAPKKKLTQKEKKAETRRLLREGAKKIRDLVVQERQAGRDYTRTAIGKLLTPPMTNIELSKHISYIRKKTGIGADFYGFKEGGEIRRRRPTKESKLKTEEKKPPLAEAKEPKPETTTETALPVKAEEPKLTELVKPVAKPKLPAEIAVPAKLKPTTGIIGLPEIKLPTGRHAIEPPIVVYRRQIAFGRTEIVKIEVLPDENVFLYVRFGKQKELYRMDLRNADFCDKSSLEGGSKRISIYELKQQLLQRMEEKKSIEKPSKPNPQGSPAECLKDLFDNRETLKKTGITVPDTIEMPPDESWRRTKMPTGPPGGEPSSVSFSKDTLKEELNALVRLGFLRKDTSQKTHVYHLTDKLLNLTQEQLEQIRALPELIYPSKFPENEKELGKLQDRIKRILTPIWVDNMYLRAKDGKLILIFEKLKQFLNGIATLPPEEVRQKISDIEERYKNNELEFFGLSQEDSKILLEKLDYLKNNLNSLSNKKLVIKIKEIIRFYSGTLKESRKSMNAVLKRLEIPHHVNTLLVGSLVSLGLISIFGFTPTAATSLGSVIAICVVYGTAGFAIGSQIVSSIINADGIEHKVKLKKSKKRYWQKKNIIEVFKDILERKHNMIMDKERGIVDERLRSKSAIRQFLKDNNCKSWREFFEKEGLRYPFTNKDIFGGSPLKVFETLYPWAFNLETPEGGHLHPWVFSSIKDKGYWKGESGEEHCVKAIRHIIEKHNGFVMYEDKGIVDYRLLLKGREGGKSWRMLFTKEGLAGMINNRFEDSTLKALQKAYPWAEKVFGRFGSKRARKHFSIEEFLFNPAFTWKLLNVKYLPDTQLVIGRRLDKLLERFPQRKDEIVRLYYRKLRPFLINLYNLRKNKTHEKFYQNIFSGIQGKLNTTILIRYYLEYVLGWEDLDSMDVSSDNKIKEFFRAKGVKSIYELFRKAGLSGVRRTFNGSLISAIRYAYTNPLYSIILKDKALILNKPIEGGIQEQVEMLLNGDIKNLYTNILLEDGSNLEVYGKYLPAIFIPEDMSAKLREKLEKLPNVTPIPKPFLMARVSSKDNRPLAYFVLHPEKDDELILLSSRLEGFKPNKLFNQLYSLASTFSHSTKRKKFKATTYEWIISYIAGHYHYNNLIKFRLTESLNAFIQTLQDMRNLKPQGKFIGEVSLSYVLMKIGFDVFYISTSYKLYMHYKTLGTDIKELFQNHLNTKPPLVAFIDTLEELRKISPYRLFNASNLEGVLTGLGFKVAHINSYYKLYMHYKQDKGLSKNVDIKELFQNHLNTKPPLVAFIDTLEGLKKISNYKLLNEGNLGGVLTGLGFKVAYISTLYKLYFHYKDKGIDIKDVFQAHLNTKPPLIAFIDTLEELRKISPHRLLNASNLEGVLKGLGFRNIAFISKYYKLYTHYKEKGIDIKDVFQKHLSAKSPFIALIDTMDELRNVSDHKFLNERDISSTLRFMGVRVRYPLSRYRCYIHWLKNGFEVDIEFGKLFKEGKSEEEILDILADRLRNIGLPKGRYDLGLRTYIRFVLISLGKIKPLEYLFLLGEDEKGISLIEKIIPDKRAEKELDLALLELDMERFLEIYELSQTEKDILEMILEGYAKEEMMEELKIIEEELSNAYVSLIEKLGAYFGYYTTRVEPAVEETQAEKILEKPVDKNKDLSKWAKDWSEKIRTAITELLKEGKKQTEIKRKDIIEKINNLYKAELKKKLYYKWFDNILRRLKRDYGIGRDKLGYPKPAQLVKLTKEEKKAAKEEQKKAFWIERVGLVKRLIGGRKKDDLPHTMIDIGALLTPPLSGPQLSKQLSYAEKVIGERQGPYGFEKDFREKTKPKDMLTSDILAVIIQSKKDTLSFIEKGLLDKAERSLLNAVELFSKYNESEEIRLQSAYTIIKVCDNLAESYRKQGNLKKAEYFLNMAYDLFNKYRDIEDVMRSIRYIIACYKNIAKAYINQDEPKEAERLLQIAHKLFNEYSNVENSVLIQANNISGIFYDLIIAYIKKGLYRKAEEIMDMALKFNSKYKDRITHIVAHIRKLIEPLQEKFKKCLTIEDMDNFDKRYTGIMQRLRKAATMFRLRFVNEFLVNMAFERVEKLRTPQGSPAECLRDLFGYVKAFKDKGITVPDIVTVPSSKNWRTPNMTRAPPVSFSDTTLRQELDALADLGFLEKYTSKRPYEYSLTNKLLNLTEAQLNRICRLPQMEHPSRYPRAGIELGNLNKRIGRILSDKKTRAVNIKQISWQEWRKNEDLKSIIRHITKKTFDIIGIDYDRRALKESFSKDSSLAFTAEVNGKIIGFISGYPDIWDKGTFYLAFRAIKDEYQERGIGAKLRGVFTNAVIQKGYSYLEGSSKYELIPEGAEIIREEFKDDFREKYFRWKLDLSKYNPDLFSSLPNQISDIHSSDDRTPQIRADYISYVLNQEGVEISPRQAEITANVLNQLLNHPQAKAEDICAEIRVTREDLIDVYKIIKKSAGLQKILVNKNKTADVVNDLLFLLKNKDHLNRYFKGEVVYPLIVEFHPGEDCVNSCVFCYSRHDKKSSFVYKGGDKKQLLTAEKAEELIDEFAKNGTKEIWISGGLEPLAAKGLTLAILSAARRNNLKTRLYTNGYLFDEEAQKAALDAGWVRFDVSGITEKMFTGVHRPASGKDAFKKTVRSIKKFIKLKRAYNSKVKIGMCYLIVPQPANYKDLIRAVEFAYKTEFDFLDIRVDMGGIVRKFNDGEIAEISRQIAIIIKNIRQGRYGNLKLNLRGIKPEELRAKDILPDLQSAQSCCASLIKLAVNPYGAVFACSYLADPSMARPQFEIGNFTTEEVDGVIRSANKSRSIASCQEEGIICLIHERTINSLIEKLKSDNKFGMSIEEQPFKIDEVINKPNILGGWPIWDKNYIWVTLMRFGNLKFAPFIPLGPIGLVLQMDVSPITYEVIYPEQACELLRQDEVFKKVYELERTRMPAIFQRSPSQLRNMIDDKGHLFFLLKNNDELIGYAVFIPDATVLARLVIASGGTGGGSILLERIIRHIAKLGVNKIQMTPTEQSRGFFEKFAEKHPGLVQIGTNELGITEYRIVLYRTELNKADKRPPAGETRQAVPAISTAQKSEPPINLPKIELREVKRRSWRGSQGKKSAIEEFRHILEEHHNIIMDKKRGIVDERLRSKKDIREFLRSNKCKSWREFFKKEGLEHPFVNKRMFAASPLKVFETLYPWAFVLNTSEEKHIHPWIFSSVKDEGYWRGIDGEKHSTDAIRHIIEGHNGFVMDEDKGIIDYRLLLKGRDGGKSWRTLFKKEDLAGMINTIFEGSTLKALQKAYPWAAKIFEKVSFKAVRRHISLEEFLFNPGFTWKVLNAKYFPDAQIVIGRRLDKLLERFPGRKDEIVRLYYKKLRPFLISLYNSKNKTHEEFYYGIFTGLQGRLNATILIRYFLECVLGWENLDTMDVSSDKKIKEFFRAKGVKSIYDLFNKANLSGVRHAFNSSIIAAIRYAHTSPLSYMIFKDKTLILDKPIEEGIQEQVEMLLSGDVKNLHTNILSEDGPNLEVYGKYLPAAFIPEDMPAKLREKLEKLPNVTPIPKPFLMVRVSSEDNKPLAYFVLYPDRDNKLTLLSASVKEFKPSVIFDKLYNLAFSFSDGIKKIKIQKRGYEQLIIYMAGYHYYNNLINYKCKSLRAFIQTLIDLQRLEPKANIINQRRLQKILFRFGFRTRHLPTLYRLYLHYKNQGIDIKDVFQKHRATKPSLTAFIDTLDELRNISDYRLLNEGNLQNVLGELGIGSIKCIHISYRLYFHYKNQNIHLDQIYTKYLGRNRRLFAFVYTLRELKNISDYKYLNEIYLQDVLKGLGFHASYLSISCRLYLHYKNQGIDIKDVFQRHRATKPPLTAFIDTLDELKKISDYKLLNGRNLRTTLLQLGVNVRYIKFSHELYIYWIENGFDVGIEYDKLFKEGKSDKEILDILTEKLRYIDLPKGRRKSSLSFYIKSILIGIGKIKPSEFLFLLGSDEKGRSLIEQIVPYKKALEDLESVLFKLEVEDFKKRYAPSDTEEKILNMIMEGYEKEEMIEELGVTAEAFSESRGLLIRKLSEYFILQTQQILERKDTKDLQETPPKPISKAKDLSKWAKDWSEKIRTAITELLKEGKKQTEIKRKNIIEKISLLYKIQLTYKQFDNIVYRLKKDYGIERDKLGYAKPPKTAKLTREKKVAAKQRQKKAFWIKRVRLVRQLIRERKKDGLPHTRTDIGALFTPPLSGPQLSKQLSYAEKVIGVKQSPYGFEKDFRVLPPGTPHRTRTSKDSEAEQAVPATSTTQKIEPSLNLLNLTSTSFEQVKGIIFDLNGVLLDGNYSVVLDKFEEKLGEKIPRQKLNEIIFIDEDAGKVRTGDISLEKFWQNSNEKFKEYGASITQDEFLDTLFRGYKLVGGAEGLVRDLKARGYKVAILSNHFNGGREVLERQIPFLDVFDLMVLSNEIKQAKPARDAFTVVLDKLGLKAEETVFFDDQQKNVAAAQESGIFAYCHDLRKTGLRNMPEIEALLAARAAKGDSKGSKGNGSILTEPTQTLSGNFAENMDAFEANRESVPDRDNGDTFPIGSETVPEYSQPQLAQEMAATPHAEELMPKPEDEQPTAAPDAAEQLTAQNKPDIENTLWILNKLILKEDEEGKGKYYTIRYNETKIPQGSPAEALLKIYVEQMLPMYMSGKDRIELKPSGAQDQGLISVKCYRDRSRNNEIGEGHVDIDEDINGKALRLIGMLNMAFIASHIPNNASSDEIVNYDPLISLIKKQYEEISGEKPTEDALRYTSEGIWIRLPHAARVSIERVEEYYRLTTIQLRKST